jgi:hypothetical protein
MIEKRGVIMEAMADGGVFMLGCGPRPPIPTVTPETALDDSLPPPVGETAVSQEGAVP